MPSRRCFCAFAVTFPPLSLDPFLPHRHLAAGGVRLPCQDLLELVQLLVSLVIAERDARQPRVHDHVGERPKLFDGIVDIERILTLGRFGGTTHRFFARMNL